MADGIDLDALRRYIDSHVDGGTAGPLAASQISGGRSNLTYEVTDGTRAWVLRRPPLGEVMASTHDMSREYRVTRGLADTGVPVPTALALESSGDVLGAPFYLMDKVDGVVYRSREQVAAIVGDGTRRLGNAIIDTLADLHEVDYAAVGLADLGKPDGYLQRQVSRWQRQWHSVAVHDLPRVDDIARRLADSIPAAPGAGIVHGDYRIDNLMAAPDDPGRVTAVLDWEMATLGDPLTDLGLLVSFWDEPGRPHNPLTGGLMATEGFPRAGEVVSRYADRRGLDDPQVDWYLVFAHFKMVVILEQIHARHVAGNTVGEGFEEVGPMVEPTLQLALEHAAAAADPTLRGG